MHTLLSTCEGRETVSDTPSTQEKHSLSSVGSHTRYMGIMMQGFFGRD